MFTAFNDVINQFRKSIKQEKARMNPTAPQAKPKPIEPPKHSSIGSQGETQAVQTSKTEQTQTTQEKRKAAIGNTLKSLGFKDDKLKEELSKLSGDDAMRSFNNMKATALLMKEKSIEKPSLTTSCLKQYSEKMQINGNKDNLMAIGIVAIRNSDSSSNVTETKLIKLGEAIFGKNYDPDKIF